MEFSEDKLMAQYKISEVVHVLLSGTHSTSVSARAFRNFAVAAAALPLLPSPPCP